MSRYPMLKVMKAYGNDNPTREEYINFIYAGTPPVDEAGDLDPELEAELPKQFQRVEKVAHEQEAAAEENVKAMVDECIATWNGGLTNDDFTRRTSGDEGTNFTSGRTYGKETIGDEIANRTSHRTSGAT